jgi:MtN3 and saliva related transmembrane protein
MTPAEVIGYLASACTTFSFVPQVVRILRTRDVAAISLPMYAAYTIGIALWLAYGIAIGSGPVTAANAVTLVLSASVLVLKIALARSRPDRADTKTRFESP